MSPQAQNLATKHKIAKWLLPQLTAPPDIKITNNQATIRISTKPINNKHLTIAYIHIKPAQATIKLITRDSLTKAGHVNSQMTKPAQAIFPTLDKTGTDYNIADPQLIEKLNNDLATTIAKDRIIINKTTNWFKSH